MRGAEQLPGPPLGEWLAHALRAAPRAAVSCGPGVRAELSSVVLELAAAKGWALGGAGAFAALIRLQVLGTAEVAEEVQRLVALVDPGGLVIELAHAPALRPWQLWRRLRGARSPRTAAELRAQAWLELGLYAVEQWAPVDAPRVLVTCGRRRAIPRA